MTTYGITHRRLAIDGHVSTVRCQTRGPGNTLTGKAEVFSVQDVARLIEGGATFEAWPWVKGTRVSRGNVSVKQDPEGRQRLVDESPGGTVLANLPGF